MFGKWREPAALSSWLGFFLLLSVFASLGVIMLANGLDSSGGSTFVTEEVLKTSGLVFD